MTPRIRRFLALVLLVATAVGCGGGDPTITSQQLATIMPSSADAPPGTTLGASESGPRTLVEFVSETDVRRKLEQLGFKVAYQATFATPAFPADPSKAPPGAALYGAFAVVLRDGKAATNGLAFYSKRVQKRAKDATPVVTEELGPDAFAYRFSSLPEAPLPGAVYFWRVGNALFSVVGAGNPGPEPAAVRALATTIDRRAKRS